MNSCRQGRECFSQMEREQGWQWIADANLTRTLWTGRLHPGIYMLVPYHHERITDNSRLMGTLYICTTCACQPAPRAGGVGNQPQPYQLSVQHRHHCHTSRSDYIFMNHFPNNVSCLKHAGRLELWLLLLW